MKTARQHVRNPIRRLRLNAASTFTSAPPSTTGHRRGRCVSRARPHSCALYLTPGILPPAKTHSLKPRTAFARDYWSTASRGVLCTARSSVSLLRCRCFGGLMLVRSCDAGDTARPLNNILSSPNVNAKVDRYHRQEVELLSCLRQM
jgi:hypothetical protein